MRIDAGKLDRRLTLLSPTNSQDATGQQIQSWTVAGTVWGQRLELRTADVMRAGGAQSVPTGRYLIRWRAGITTDMSVRIDGQDYAITALDEPDRRTTLILSVEWTGPAQ